MILNNKILTKTGYKYIKELKVGDIVLSFNVEKNIQEYNKVTNTFIDTKDNLLELSINDKNICVTKEHPFYSGKEYIEAKDLKINDTILSKDNKLLKIDNIKQLDETYEVYNIEVENNHNYYLEDVLVHNFAYGSVSARAGSAAAAVKAYIGGAARSTGSTPKAGGDQYYTSYFVNPHANQTYYNGNWISNAEYNRIQAEISRKQREINELNKEAKILNELNDATMALEREWKQSGTDIQTFLTQAGIPLKNQSAIIECMNNAGKTGNNTNKRLIEIGEKRNKLKNEIIAKGGKVDNTKDTVISDSYRPTNVNHDPSEFGVNPNLTIKYDPKNAQSAKEAAERILGKAQKFEEASNKYKNYSKGIVKDDKVNVKNDNSITKAGSNLISAITAIQGEFEKNGRIGDNELNSISNDIGNLGGYPSSRGGSTPGVVDYSGGRSNGNRGAVTIPGVGLVNPDGTVVKPGTTTIPTKTISSTSSGNSNNGNINFDVNNLKDLSENETSDTNSNWLKQAYYNKKASDAVFGKGVLKAGTTFIDGLRKFFTGRDDKTLTSKVDQYYDEKVYTSSFYQKASDISGLDYHSTEARIIETAGYLTPDMILMAWGGGAAIKSAEAATLLETVAPFLSKGLYSFVQGVGEGTRTDGNAYTEGVKEVVLDNVASINPVTGVANMARNATEYYNSLDTETRELETMNSTNTQSQPKNEYGYDPQPAEIIFGDEIE